LIDGVTIRERRKPAQQREVYFVQARTLKLIKIGVADNALRRVRDLALMCPDQLEVLGVLICYAAGKTEEELHRRFDADRRHGEWFLPSPGLLSFIADEASLNERRIARMQRACDVFLQRRGRWPAADALNLARTDSEKLG
jgi:hypothetical protein